MAVLSDEEAAELAERERDARAAFASRWAGLGSGPVSEAEWELIVFGEVGMFGEES